MTTFQAFISALIHGITQFLPIGVKGHTFLINYLIDWPQPSAYFLETLAFGSFISLFIYYRHDWASMISGFLQVLLLRRRPMTLDERLPFFLIISTLPFGVLSYVIKQKNIQIEATPFIIVSFFMATTFFLWCIDFLNRKTKNMCDWKWTDGLIIGLFQGLVVFPGIDPLNCTLMGAFLLNFKTEAALKYAYFSMLPLLFSESFWIIVHLKPHERNPLPEINWLCFSIILLISIFSGLLAIGGLSRQIHEKGIKQYLIYRILITLGVFYKIFI